MIRLEHALLYLVLPLAACSGADNPAQSPSIVNIVSVAATPKPTATPEPQNLTEVDLTINGVRSGTRKAEILAKLGKPKKVERGEYDNCASEYHHHLYYDGLTINALGDRAGRDYWVHDMEVTSARWDIAPGVRIGDSITSVREIYGKPNHEDAESLTYVTKDNLGWVGFQFKGGKLVKASMSETLC